MTVYSDQTHDIRIANKSFANKVEFRYLGIEITTINDIDDETKSALNSETACYPLV
jgi:hypothetical protein